MHKLAILIVGPPIIYGNNERVKSIVLITSSNMTFRVILHT